MGPAFRRNCLAIFRLVINSGVLPQSWRHVREGRGTPTAAQPIARGSSPSKAVSQRVPRRPGRSQDWAWRLVRRSRLREPLPRPIARGAHRKHDGDLDENSHHRRESCSRVGPEKGDGDGDGQLEVIARADQGAKRRNIVWNPQPAHQSICHCGVGVDLQEDRDRDEENMGEPVGEVVGLEGDSGVICRGRSEDAGTASRVIVVNHLLSVSYNGGGGGSRTRVHRLHGCRRAQTRAPRARSVATSSVKAVSQPRAAREARTPAPLHGISRWKSTRTNIGGPC